jgi:hypothetical protein
VEFFLGLVVLPEIWVLVGEMVEVMDEFIEDCLFSVSIVQEVQELMLDVRAPRQDVLTLDTEVVEDFFHLILVVGAQLFPKQDDNRLKVVVNPVTHHLKRALC